MIFLLPTYRLTLLLLVLCFAVSAMAQDGRTVCVLTAKQEMSTAGKAAPCFGEPDLAKSRQRESEAIASLPKIARFWLAEDAVYIISPDERCAFLHLATDEERNQFIEHFWSRRARDPTSLDNSFKREHYERIVFANETFSGQLPGWKTDQGRIYVTFGPPDSIESHQRGEKTGRPPEEGPETYEFSWEAWHYKRIDGVGENIEVKFVDPSGSGDYRLALGPEEKELFFAPAHNLGLARKEGTAQATQAIEIYVGQAPAPLVERITNYVRGSKKRDTVTHVSALAVPIYEKTNDYWAEELCGSLHSSGSSCHSCFASRDNANSNEGRGLALCFYFTSHERST